MGTALQSNPLSDKSVQRTVRAILHETVFSPPFQIPYRASFEGRYWNFLVWLLQICSLSPSTNDLHRMQPDLKLEEFLRCLSWAGHASGLEKIRNTHKILVVQGRAKKATWRTGMVKKSTAVPLQAWSGPEGSRKLRFLDFLTTAQDGDKVVSLTHRPHLPPGNTPGTHFC
jgi:hypothetical protein